MIDSRAVIHEGARLGEGVEIAPFAVIGPNVTLGDGVQVGSHAVVDGWTTVGAGCRIFPHAVVGMIPQDLKYNGERTTLDIGERTMIREFATVNLGTAGGGGATKVGCDCLLMAYSHVAHDCIVGNHVILANAATLAGHIFVEDWVIVGGLTAIHQFVRIGEHAMLGGCSAITMDVPPYVTASGNRAALYGLNLVGLKRRNFSDEAVKGLKKAYKDLFQSSDTLAAALEKLRATEDYAVPEVKRFVDFVASSERGVTR